MKQPWICDTETNALQDYTKFHVCVFRSLDDKEVHVFRRINEYKYEKNRLRQFVANHVSGLIGHNFIGYDIGVLRHFGIVDIDLFNPENKVEITDTLVLSRMMNYKREQGHSLESYSKDVGTDKVQITDFSEWTPELEERCVSDTKINLGVYNLYKKYTEAALWKEPIRLEHLTAALCNTIGYNGISFNTPLCLSLINTLDTIVSSLREEFNVVFPPQSVLLREITPKVTKKGTLNSKDFRWKEDNDLTMFRPDQPFSLFEYKPFNPDSPLQRVQRLNAAGWKPTDKTDGHKEAIRTDDKEKIAKFKITGWKTNEENLDTLPDTAPEGARKLVQYLLLSSRLADLREWIALVRSSNDGTDRIYGTINSIGSWTMRCSHQNPNLANIPATYNRQGKLALYGKECRSLFGVPPGYKQVGVDAEGIQLRIFANLCEDEKLIKAIESGEKEKKTDVHHLNMGILLPILVTREVAKTYIYALLLGAGFAKQASILNCTVKQAIAAYRRILDFYPGWAKLQQGRLARESEKGYIEALDGRYIPLAEPRLVLTAHLQSGEKIIMAKAAANWIKSLEYYKQYYKLINWVHDEWQTEVYNDEEEFLPWVVGQRQVEGIRLAGRQLNMNIKLDGKAVIGENWSMTH